MGTARPYLLSFAAQGTLLEAARALEAQVVPNSDFAPYESSSLFLTVTDATGEVVAASRVVLPGAAGLKTINDITAASRRAGQRLSLRIDSARTWDIASFVVRPGSEDLAAAALCHGLVQAIRVNRVRFVVGALDECTRQLLSGAGLVPAVVVGTEAGSRSAVWGRVSELLDVQRQVNADGYRLMAQGVGMADVSLPRPAELRVTPPLRVALAGAAVRTLAETA